jgi:hypothetical protein
MRVSRRVRLSRRLLPPLLPCLALPLTGRPRHVEFVARDLAELTPPVVHLSLSVRSTAAKQIANGVGRRPCSVITATITATADA